MADSPTFDGFGPDALAFLDGLAAENTKAYFDAHRATYDEQIVVPLKCLVMTIGERLQRQVSAGIRYEPKVGQSLFRINRDLRFARDQTPYHVHLDLVVWEGEHPRSSPGFILRIAPDEVVVGAGVFRLADDRLARWRTAVADDERGTRLVELIDAACLALPGASMSEPTRKRVPKGFPTDHERGALLRSDGLHVSAASPTPASITSPQFATWCVDRQVKLAEVHRWLVAELDG